VCGLGLVGLVEIQAAYYMVAATGVLVAALYYIYNVRAAQRSMRIGQETRQIQLLMDFNRDVNEGFRSMKNYMEAAEARWSDFEDYLAKYGPSVDPEGHGYRLTMWRRMHFMGLMVRDGLIGLEAFMEYVGDVPASMWDKYGGLIEEYRVRFHLPSYMAGFEYLAGEVNDYRLGKGWGAKTPDDIFYPMGADVDG
jgi:hypothetical protein